MDHVFQESKMCKCNSFVSSSCSTDRVNSVTSFDLRLFLSLHLLPAHLAAPWLAGSTLYAKVSMCFVVKHD